MLDTNLAYYGASRKQDDGGVGGLREGHLFFADFGMPCVSCRKPKIGYRSNATVIGEDRGFVFLGMDAHVQGGVGPKQWVEALKMRDKALDMQGLDEVFVLVKKPLFGS